VVAAENGIVVFAGNEIPGFGQMLLISHADGFMTAYAHNRELLVGVGDRVERGQKVAAVGRTGNVRSPQLHFELRDGKEPIDPVELLDTARTQVASVR
jgi:murein DD-endopeptidase MepM/ murein hydrolase activator NlpD